MPYIKIRAIKLKYIYSNYAYILKTKQNENRFSNRHQVFSSKKKKKLKRNGKVNLWKQKKRNNKNKGEIYKCKAKKQQSASSIPGRTFRNTIQNQRKRGDVTHSIKLKEDELQILEGS